ncbi:MAG: methyltransferase [Bdellovibrionota bacterium]
MMMNGYSQPPDYRFSHDSVELAQRASEFLVEATTNRTGPIRILDLGAGSGVVGLEIARFAKCALKIDFVEIQPEYGPHFEQNLKWIQGLAPGFTGTWRQMNYEHLLVPEEAEKYDLVVSNPPFFDRGQGNLPPSPFKARARFFLDSSFERMCEAIAHVLRPGGQAYFLVRDLGDHGLDRVASLNRSLLPVGEWRAREPVRGTELIQFVKR